MTRKSSRAGMRDDGRCRVSDGLEIAAECPQRLVDPSAIEPAFAERRLGAWNLRSVAETEDALRQGVTPPGGEANQKFVERIGAALQAWLPRLPEQPLLVGSKGVARVLRELSGSERPPRPLANGALAHFDLTAYALRCAAASPV